MKVKDFMRKYFEKKKSVLSDANNQWSSKILLRFICGLYFSMHIHKSKSTYWEHVSDYISR